MSQVNQFFENFEYKEQKFHHCFRLITGKLLTMTQKHTLKLLVYNILRKCLQVKQII